jgi:hypothetical protein
MRHADTAMYQAKAQGRDSASSSAPRWPTRAQSRLAMEASCAMRWSGAAAPGVAAAGGSRAWRLADESFVGTVTGAEGLLRWQHPNAGTGAAQPVHPGGRGDRADRADRRLGHRAGLPADRRLAAEGLPPMTVARSTCRRASCAKAG